MVSVLWYLHDEQNSIKKISINSLIKEEKDRPKYSKLLQHPFIQRGEQSHTDVAVYVAVILEEMERNGITPFTTNEPAECWYD